MKLPVNDSKNFVLTPAGNHVAICYAVIDLGTQTTVYDGTERIQRKIRIIWELPDELMEDGQPFAIGKTYTFSTHEKANLRKDLESWRGVPFQDSDFGESGFDIEKLLGVGCLLGVIHVKSEDGSKNYANITSVARLPKGMKAPALTNPKCFFTFDNPDSVVFNALPDWIREVIAKSPEFKAVDGGVDESDAVDNPATGDYISGVISGHEDIPF